MKINLPTSVISDCLENSQVFRDYVASLLSGDPTLASRVLAIMQKNVGNKLGTIREIRELSSGCVEEFIRAFPNAGFAGYWPGGTLVLKDSKDFVESYPQFKS